MFRLWISPILCLCLWAVFPSSSYASSAAKVYFAKTDKVYVIWDFNTCTIVSNGSVSIPNVKTEGECVSTVSVPVFELYLNQNQNTFLQTVILLTWTDFISFTLFCLVLFCFLQMLPS